jgi:transmembrane sensor
MTDPRDPLSQLGRLKQHLAAELSEHDIERLVRGGAERRQRGRLRRTLSAGLVVGAVSTALVVFLLFRWTSFGASPAPQAPLASSRGSSSSVSASPRAPEVVALSDASRVTALARDLELAVEEDASERIRLHLTRGSARFEVTRRPSRSFSVRAGDVTVSVVGTTFAVEVVADRVGVSVEHGVVEVDWGLGRKQLVAGERGWFPPLVLSGEPQASEREPEHEPRPADQSAHKTPRARGVSSSPGSALGAQELLAEVDAARSRGEPERAVELLREILREHPADPRTPLAAFTLGRMLLNELGRPSEAAAAFHEVRRRAPSGQFAEDALAREVEAWSRASEPERAHALAKLYLERYPSGRHARRVQALSGLQ